MSREQRGQVPLPPDTRRRRDAMTVFVLTVGWFWAVALVAAREHQIVLHDVLASAPALWGFLALPAWKLLTMLLAGGVFAAACVDTARRRGRWLGTAGRWLMLAYSVPLLDALRVLGVVIEYTFWEPLLLTGISGAAMAALTRDGTGVGAFWSSRSSSGTGAVAGRKPVRLAANVAPWTPWAITGLLTVAAGGWWYLEGCRAYDEFMLGYHDFGHFAYRVASTWEGRGFLLETPSLPAFWDHFNPGLALLAPLWGLWPDARLFLLLQAVCLALPALGVFCIAQAWGVRPAGAAMWAAAYLAFPAVGQLNLNYSYGWHPISLALPLMFAAVAALLAGRWGWAAGLAVLACSFEEAVIVAWACLAAALGLQAWWSERGGRLGHGLDAPEAALARRLPAWAWLAIWATCTVAFVLIARYAAFTQYQTERFANLGDSGIEIALSPLLRPKAFWGQTLSLGSMLFLCSLLLPLTPAALLPGRLILLAAVFPLGLLMGWDHPPAKSIAFQYVTTLLPILFLSAVAGDRRLAAPREAVVAGRPKALRESNPAAGLAALVSCLVASTFFGALPWSSPTLAVMRARTYQGTDGPSEQNPRRPGTASHRELNEIVARVNSKQASAIASGRIAAHLLNVRRLETVEQAIVRWDALCAEAGAGRSGAEVFDWIVVDTCECFQQSLEKTEFILAEARRAGYQEQVAREGLVVLARPPGNGG
ncbi:MAG: DUF2079 domain-containing protein [Candidatus Anammoximicrobium sp.]|nr:DUF2079 domain-containing protein [Candidatus Anammoximicrobium sp.]